MKKHILGCLVSSEKSLVFSYILKCDTPGLFYFWDYLELERWLSSSGIFYFCKRLGFNPQHLYGTSQPPVIQVPGDLMSSSPPQLPCTLGIHIYTNKQNIHTHKTRTNTLWKTICLWPQTYHVTENVLGPDPLPPPLRVWDRGVYEEIVCARQALPTELNLQVYVFCNFAMLGTEPTRLLYVISLS